MWSALHRLNGVFAVVVGIAGAEGRGDSTPRNVVLITIDALRADHLGCYGYSRDTSPNLDRFAKSHAFFRNAVVQWPKTTPSLASLLTGMYPHSTGIVRKCELRVDDDFVMLAERFKQAGYATLGVVANSNLDPQYGFQQGFDVYLEHWKEHENVTAMSKGPVSEARWVTDLALNGVSRIDRSRPKFVWVHYIDPHAPYTPPLEYADRFLDERSERLAQRAPLKPGVSVEGYGFGGIEPSIALGEEQRVAVYAARYDAEIYTTDEQVQALLDGLKTIGVLDGALVVITADHGESLGEHNYYFEHGALPYEGCAHVPLLIAWPGRDEPQIVDDPVGLIDLAPTMLDFAGVPLDDALEGTSLRSVLEQGADPPQQVFMASGSLSSYQRCIRVGPWKLVFVPSPIDQVRMAGSEFELYNVESDPLETHNVLAQRPELASTLEKRLMKWIASGQARHAREHESEAPIDARTESLLRTLGYVR